MRSTTSGAASSSSPALRADRSSDGAARGATSARPWRLLVLGCLALAGLSLLGPHRPTYDPWSWLIWGREIAHLDLVTTAGPSWKPLPVLFTTPFSLFGDSAAPLLWLLVARTGGLLAIALAYRVASRIAGTAAGGIIAALALVLANDFVDSFARGNSEGLLVAASLWAIERHLDGRFRDAFLFGVVAALLRPESWPFVALYGVWLVHRKWASPGRRRNVAMVTGAAALVALLWLVPEYIGSGNLLRAASRAREPVAGSPAQTANPFLSVFDNGSSALNWPIYAGAVLAALFALGTFVRERRITPALALGAIATALMILVGLLAEAGFTGNLRYVTLPAAVLCVLGGVGWAQLIATAARRYGRVAAAALGTLALAASAQFVVDDVSRLGDQLEQLRDAARVSAALPDLIRQAGGETAVKRCSPIYTGRFEVPLVAWELHIHQDQAHTQPHPPGTLILPRAQTITPDPRFPPRAATDRWILGSSCPRA